MKNTIKGFGITILCVITFGYLMLPFISYYAFDLIKYAKEKSASNTIHRNDWVAYFNLAGMVFITLLLNFFVWMFTLEYFNVI